MPNSAKQEAAILRNENKRLEEELERERALWPSPSTAGRLTRNCPQLMHALAMLDTILASDKLLKACTGMTRKHFDYLLPLFIEEIERRKKTPLFRDGGPGASDPGNRCSLERRHALLLVIMRCKTGATQGHLAVQFGVDQSTVCRYIKACMPILEAILPTPDKYSKEIAACKTDEERVKFLIDGCKGRGKDKGKMLLDGTRTPRARPSDGEEQKDFYTRKNKMHCLNTVAGASPSGMLLYASETLPGSRHDIVMVGGLGKVFPSMADPRTPDGERITVVGDAGFQGLGKRLPGTIPVTPHKRKPGKDLTAARKEANRKLSRMRSLIERIFERMKGHKILRVPFEGTPEQFHRVFNTVGGLVNLVRAFDEISSGAGLHGSLATKWRGQRLKRPPRR